jgi:hypothetical protein
MDQAPLPATLAWLKKDLMGALSKGEDDPRRKEDPKRVMRRRDLKPGVPQ